MWLYVYNKLFIRVYVWPILAETDVIDDLFVSFFADLDVQWDPRLYIFPYTRESSLRYCKKWIE